MKSHLIAAAIVLALPLAVVPARAQTGDAQPPSATAPTAKKAPAAKKTAATKKTVTTKKMAVTKKTASAPKTAPDAKAAVGKKTGAKKRKVPAKTAKAVEAATPVQSLSERLSDAELAIARDIQTGAIQCELGANVTVAADESNPGYFNITAGKQHYYMHPVESRTGAIRMEDGRAGAMWLQLGNKSMLMDQKKGQRVADECATATQREYAAHMQEHPEHHLLEDPAK